MGFRTSWIAVQDVAADDIIDMLGLQQLDGVEDYAAEGIWLTEHDTGWSVISYGTDTDRTAEARLLSQDAAVVAVTLSDTVMVSSIASWADGKPGWSIAHDAEAGIRKLEVSGAPPAVFDEVKAAALVRQDAADANGGLPVDHIYDVPMDLGQAITGHRHDDPSGPMHTPLGIAPKPGVVTKKNLVLSLVDWFRAQGWEEHGNWFRSPVDADWSIMADTDRHQMRKPTNNVLATPRVGIFHRGVAQTEEDLAHTSQAPTFSVPLGAVLGLHELKLCTSPEMQRVYENPVNDLDEALAHYSVAFDRLRDWCNPAAFTRAFSLGEPTIESWRMSGTKGPATLHILPSNILYGRLIADAHFGWDSFSDAFFAEHETLLPDDFKVKLKGYLAANPPDPANQRADDPFVPARLVLLDDTQADEVPTRDTTAPEPGQALATGGPPGEPPAPEPSDASSPKAGVLSRLFKRKG